MKIDPKTAGPVSAPAERVAETRRTPQLDRTEGSQRSKDSTEVKFDREKLERLKAELDRLPEVRQDRVDALRRTLFEGKYRIDEHKVAEAVWADRLEPARPGE